MRVIPWILGALSEVLYELSARHPGGTRRKQQYAIWGGTHVKVSFLNENTANKRGFLGELGLSLLIEWDGGKILFDPGPVSYTHLDVYKRQDLLSA